MSTETTPSGAFAFDLNQPGIYFLSVTESNPRDPKATPMAGLIPISLEPDAAAEHLDLELGWSDCGLFYLDLLPCPRPNLLLQQLRGRVIGPSGELIVKGRDLLNHTVPPFNPDGYAIENADIYLVDPGGNLVEHLVSGPSGEFASSRPLTGAYDLFVRDWGYGTLRARLLAAPAEVQPNGALTVQLEHQCSEARLQ